MILILFTTSAPNPLTEELSVQGHQVFEALAISEILALAEQHPLAQIIITSDVEPERATVIQQHYPTMTLETEPAVEDVLWELNQKGTKIQ